MLNLVPAASILAASLLATFAASLWDATAGYAGAAILVASMFWLSATDPDRFTDVLSERHRLVLVGSRNVVIPWSSVDRFEPVRGVELLLAALHAVWRFTPSTTLTRDHTYVLRTRPHKSRGARTFYVSLHDAVTVQGHYAAARR